MDFRYLDADGKERTLTSTVALVEAIRRGDVTANTLVHEPKENRWIKAEVQEDFEAIVSAPKPAGDVETGKQFKKDRRSGWLLIVGGLVGILVVGGLSGLPGQRVGYAFGQALFYGAVCAGIVQYFARNNTDWKSAGRDYLAGGVAFLVACTFVLAFQVREYMQEQATLRALQARIDVATTPGAASPEPTVEAPSSNLYGAQGASLIRIMDTAQMRSARVNAEYTASVEKLSLDTMLIPETVVSAAGRRDGRVRLQKWRDEMDKLEAGQRAIHQQIIAQVEAAPDLEPGVKAETISGVRGSQINASTNEFMEVQRDVAALTDEIYTFIETRTGAVGVENGVVAFELDSDVRRYNEFLVRLNTLIERENASIERQKTALAEGKAALGKLSGGQ